MKKKLEIFQIGNNQQNVLFQKIFNFFEDYLEMKLHSLNYDFQIQNLKQKKIDFLFVFYKKKLEFVFDWNLYYKLHLKNKKYKFIWLIKEEDIKLIPKLLKNGADDFIIYNQDKKLLKWKIFSLLRRRWDEFNKNSKKIYKSFILDKNNGKVFINNNESKEKLTKKEFDILWLLCEVEDFISKKEIYQKVWKRNDQDITRVFDQMFNKLKNKIGASFFVVNRQKGIKIK